MVEVLPIIENEAKALWFIFRDLQVAMMAPMVRS